VTDTPELFVGIDVQINRGLPFCILDADAVMIESGWIKRDDLTHEQQAERMRDAIAAAADGRSVAIGIDAPRMPLPDDRPWYWNGAKQKWRPKRPSDKGMGRHCEVVIKALNIANPQWTPLIGESPKWMVLGYVLFRVLAKLGEVYEVFPSASYTALENHPLSATLDFSNFAAGPKDMLDACTAALTVREYTHGRGWEAGGGDGWGTIILPGSQPPDAPEQLLRWPSNR